MGQTVTDVGYETNEAARELKTRELKTSELKKSELKKHAATIHCSNTLSLLQRKITNALLFHAYKELMLKEEHEITVKQLCRLIGYQGNNHAAIKDALKGLISTVIEWNLIDVKTGTENWTASSIIASVSLEGPQCHYAYSPRMKQLLHSPSMFGKIDLVIQSRFRSSYGLALYENCIRYRGLPHTKWFDMELFKKLMGVPAGKYDVFRDFRKRVLDKAVDEVNTYSDLNITSELQKEGRKVMKIRFTLKERPRKTRLGNHKPVARLENAAPEELNSRLSTVFGLSNEQIEQLLTSYDSQFVAEKMILIESSKAYREGRVDNLAGYLISAVKNNYQLQKTKAGAVVNIHDVRQEHEMQELLRQVESIRQHYLEYRELSIQQAIDNMTQADKQQFLAEFNKYAESTITTIINLQRSKYTRETVHDSPQVKALLRQFALRELDLLSFNSLEEFVLQLDESRREVWQKLKSYDPDHAMFRIE